MQTPPAPTRRMPRSMTRDASQSTPGTPTLNSGLQNLASVLADDGASSSCCSSPAGSRPSTPTPTVRQLMEEEAAIAYSVGKGKQFEKQRRGSKKEAEYAFSPSGSSRHLTSPPDSEDEAAAAELIWEEHMGGSTGSGAGRAASRMVLWMLVVVLLVTALCYWRFGPTVTAEEANDRREL